MNFSEKIIDGKKIAAEVNRETAAEVASITKNFGSCPGLAVVLVGNADMSNCNLHSPPHSCHLYVT